MRWMRGWQQGPSHGVKAGIAALALKTLKVVVRQTVPLDDLAQIAGKFLGFLGRSAAVVEFVEGKIPARPLIARPLPGEPIKPPFKPAGRLK